MASLHVGHADGAGLPGLAEDLLLPTAKCRTRRDGPELWGQATCQRAFLHSEELFTICNEGLGVAAVP